MLYDDVMSEPVFDASDFTPVHGFGGAAVISCIDESPIRREVFFKQADELSMKVALFPGYIWSWDTIESLGMTDPSFPYEGGLELRNQCGARKQPRFQGVVGGTNSHIKIIAEAKRLGLSSIIIFEDDATFVPDWNELMKVISSEINTLDWSVLYLGGTPARPCYKATDNISICGAAYSMHAYAVHENYYDTILQKSHCALPVDLFMYHEGERLCHSRAAPKDSPHYIAPFYIVTKCLSYQLHPQEEPLSIITKQRRFVKGEQSGADYITEIDRLYKLYMKG